MDAIQPYGITQGSQPVHRLQMSERELSDSTDGISFTVGPEKHHYFTKSFDCNFLASKLPTFGLLRTQWSCPMESYRVWCTYKIGEISSFQKQNSTFSDFNNVEAAASYLKPAHTNYFFYHQSKVSQHLKFHR